ncbi:MAG: FtsK/SpoIIIE domain-containing protein [Actinomycetaceae bacterium]|nr:FtsK/SpoIIIE domain-containing protein [Actinomycetaceae bacterium]
MNTTHTRRTTLFFVFTKGYAWGTFHQISYEKTPIDDAACYDTRLDGLHLELHMSTPDAQTSFTRQAFPKVQASNKGSVPILYRRTFVWRVLGKHPVHLSEGTHIRFRCPATSHLTNADTYAQICTRPATTTWNVPSPKKHHWYYYLSLPWLFLMPLMLLRFVPGLTLQIRWGLGITIYTIISIIAVSMWIRWHRRSQPPSPFHVLTLAHAPRAHPQNPPSTVSAFQYKRRTCHLSPGDSRCFTGRWALQEIWWWVAQALVDPQQDVRVVVYSHVAQQSIGPHDASDCIYITLEDETASCMKSDKRQPIILSYAHTQSQIPLWAHALIAAKGHNYPHFPWWKALIETIALQGHDTDNASVMDISREELPRHVTIDDIAEHLLFSNHSSEYSPESLSPMDNHVSPGELVPTLPLDQLKPPAHHSSSDSSVMNAQLIGLLHKVWQKHRYCHSLIACAGRTHGGYIDVNITKDGPHMLIAGTTGSGKSEALVSWLMSLALRYSPSDMQLILIDYKGGAAFDLLKDLPHVAGVFTDLDPSMVTRVIGSLYAELTRREHIAAYDRLHNTHHGRELPQLLMVVDEFQALASYHSSIMDDLIRLATLGRALGMYLIIATQRPAGIVDSHIRANMAIRLCLRVKEASDSIDVIGSDKASRIPGIPGRAILQTDSERSLQIPYLSPAMPALVAAVNETARRWPSRLAPPPWAPALPEHISIDHCQQLAKESVQHRSFFHAETTDDSDDTRLALGVVDEPDYQRISCFHIPANQSLLVIGGPQSGKTTTLHSVCYLRKSSGFRVHAIMSLPPPCAVDTWVHPRQIRLAVRLLNILCNADNLSDTVIVIDDCDSLAESIDQHFGPLYAQERYTGLLRELSDNNCSVTMSSQAHFASLRWATSFVHRIIHPLPHNIDSAYFASSTKMISEIDLPGRGIHIVQGKQHLIHIATPPSSHLRPPQPSRPSFSFQNDPHASVTTIESNNCNKKSQQQITLRHSVVTQLPSHCSVKPGFLGIGGDNAKPIRIGEDPWWLIVGEMGSGKSTTAAIIHDALPHTLLLDPLEPHSPYAHTPLSDPQLSNGVIATMSPSTFLHSYDSFISELKARATLIVLGNSCRNTALIPRTYSDLVPLRENLLGRAIMCRREQVIALRVAQLINN